jgi:hypothetical protein
MTQMGPRTFQVESLEECQNSDGCCWWPGDTRGSATEVPKCPNREAVC